MDNKNFASKEFWNVFWGVEKNSKRPAMQPVSDGDIPFSKIFQEYIRKSDGSERAIEIGCFPGTFIAYIAKKFGYTPEGIDFIDNFEKICANVFELNGLKNYKIYNEDFLRWKAKNKYGLVCSFGFIEHFSNPEEIVKKHIDMLDSGGTLILEVPNFNGLRYFIAKNSDFETFKKHNMKVMSLEFYKQIAEKYNLKIKYLGYVGKFEYTWANYSPSLFQKLVYYPFKLLSKATLNYQFRNKFLSSWLLFIAEKA